MSFVQVNTSYEAPKRLVLGIWGKEKVGKTSLALTMPAPIYIANFDYGYRPVLSVAEGKEVHVANYVFPDQFSIPSYKSVLSQFMVDWQDAVSSAASHNGSVVIDTASQLWTLVGECMTGEVREERAEENEQRTDGRVAKDSRLDWRKANATMDAILKRPLTIAGKESVNACYIQRATNIYEGSQDTGKIKMHGFSTTGSIVEMLLFADIEEQHLDTKTMKQVPPKYVARIDFSRYLGMQVRGVRIEDPTFDKVMNLIS